MRPLKNNDAPLFLAPTFKDLSKKLPDVTVPVYVVLPGDDALTLETMFVCNVAAALSMLEKITLVIGEV